MLQLEDSTIQIIQEASCFTNNSRLFDAWNFLLDNVDFRSLSGFKRSIHKVDFSRFPVFELLLRYILCFVYRLCFLY